MLPIHDWMRIHWRGGAGRSPPTEREIERERERERERDRERVGGRG